MSYDQLLLGKLNQRDWEKSEGTADSIKDKYLVGQWADGGVTLTPLWCCFWAKHRQMCKKTLGSQQLSEITPRETGAGEGWQPGCWWIFIHTGMFPKNIILPTSWWNTKCDLPSLTVWITGVGHCLYEHLFREYWQHSVVLTHASHYIKTTSLISNYPLMLTDYNLSGTEQRTFEGVVIYPSIRPSTVSAVWRVWQ